MNVSLYAFLVDLFTSVELLNHGVLIQNLKYVVLIRGNMSRFNLCVRFKKIQETLLTATI